MQSDALKLDTKSISDTFPVLGICYGAQLITHNEGGTVEKSDKREYGRANLQNIQSNNVLLSSLPSGSTVWMSHADSIKTLPESLEVSAGTSHIPVAAFQSKPSTFKNPVYGLQFHPEVYHTEHGAIILREFVYKICSCNPDWTPDSFIDETIENLKNTIKDDHVVLGLSGGVDSSVAALLLHKAIGKNLHCIFVNNGLLRKNEFTQVLNAYEHMGLQIRGVDASKLFLQKLSGVTDPEQKRKIIGAAFIEVFEQETQHLKEIKWLAQGTIYPDVIESVSVHGPSVTIKSHHNVGGLPEKLKLKIVEPLRNLFKDEVRKVGLALQIDPAIINRHPFPGPGLAIRILGDITQEKVELLQNADDIFISALKDSGYYDKVWQAGAILLPIHSVGVMGDERTYEQVLALRCVQSTDGMTADWSDLPHALLAEVSNKIINNVKGINRVVYDISSKPPATIEWE